jgi:hypothetical protein
MRAPDVAIAFARNVDVAPPSRAAEDEHGGQDRGGIRESGRGVV